MFYIGAANAPCRHGVNLDVHEVLDVELDADEVLMSSRSWIVLLLAASTGTIMLVTWADVSLKHHRSYTAV
eukprot:5426038-Amphidinium_carterae.2